MPRCPRERHPTERPAGFNILPEQDAAHVSRPSGGGTEGARAGARAVRGREVSAGTLRLGVTLFHQTSSFFVALYSLPIDKMMICLCIPEMNCNNLSFFGGSFRLIINEGARCILSIVKLLSIGNPLDMRDQNTL